ncbi:MAG: hypothetical protein ACRDL8_10520, partial [Solirubrobacteraceae bacterium]
VERVSDGYEGSRTDQFALRAAGSAEARLTWRSTGEFPRPAQVRVVLHAMRATEVRVDGVPVAFRPSPPTQSPPSTTVECAPFDELEVHW